MRNNYSGKKQQAVGRHSRYFQEERQKYCSHTNFTALEITLLDRFLLMIKWSIFYAY
jgi:hypothetical protein